MVGSKVTLAVCRTLSQMIGYEGNELWEDGWEKVEDLQLQNKL